MMHDLCTCRRTARKEGRLPGPPPFVAPMLPLCRCFLILAMLLLSDAAKADPGLPEARAALRDQIATERAELAMWRKAQDAELAKLRKALEVAREANAKRVKHLQAANARSRELAEKTRKQRQERLTHARELAPCVDTLRAATTTFLNDPRLACGDPGSLQSAMDQATDAPLALAETLAGSFTACFRRAASVGFQTLPLKQPDARHTEARVLRVGLVGGIYAEDGDALYGVATPGTAADWHAIPPAQLPAEQQDAIAMALDPQTQEALLWMPLDTTGGALRTHLANPRNWWTTLATGGFAAWLLIVVALLGAVDFGRRAWRGVRGAVPKQLGWLPGLAALALCLGGLGLAAGLARAGNATDGSAGLVAADALVVLQAGLLLALLCLLGEALLQGLALVPGKVESGDE